MKPDDCTQKPQSPEQILADKHKGRKCLIVITWSYRDNGKFQRPWSAGTAEGSQSKTWRRADLQAASRLYQRGDGGLTRPECLFTFRKWKHWITTRSSEKDMTRVPVATNQTYWSKTNDSSFFDHPCSSPSLGFLQKVFLINKIQEIFQILIRHYDHSQKRPNISFQDAPLTEEIRFRPDIQKGHILKLNAKILQTTGALRESDSETHYSPLKSPRC